MMDGMVLPEAAEAPADGMTAEELQAEIAALAARPDAEYAARRAAAAVRLGTTRRDLDSVVKAARARRRAEAEAAARTAPEPGPGEVRWPAGILARPDGLYADAGGDASRLWLAAPFEVMGEARNASSEGWGLFLRRRDRDGRPHTWAMPARLLMAEPGALEAAFVERGLRVSADPRARLRLRMALAEVTAGGRVRLAPRAGWQEPPDTAFLLPDGEVIGTSAEAVVLENPPEDAARLCATAGTLDDWQREVAALAVGNPLAAFCLSAAFASPLLHVVRAAGGGVHIHGGSKRGKTLAAQMGLSAWGLPYKGAGLRDWNSTANAFEATAEEAGDMLLVLDELHQANPTEVARTVYAMADGAGKKRLDRNAHGRRRRTWRAFILSTGEHDLGTAVTKAGQLLPAGADVRLPSVPVGDAVATWPALHGRDSLQVLWTDLHRGMQAHHGEAARAFLRCLTASLAAGPGQVEDTAAAMRDRFLQGLPAGADPQVQEVARRFALVAAAGTLATVWGVLPWPAGEAEQAAGTVLAQWLAARPGGAADGETAAQLERVRLFLVQHGASRFAVLAQDAAGTWVEAHPERPVANRVGWRRPRDRRHEYLIAPEAWRAELCAPASLDPQATARTLAEAGFLRRGDAGRLTVKERVPGLANPGRFYAVSAALLEAPEAADRDGSGA